MERGLGGRWGYRCSYRGLISGGTLDKMTTPTSLRGSSWRAVDFVRAYPVHIVVTVVACALGGPGLLRATTNPVEGALVIGVVGVCVFMASSVLAIALLLASESLAWMIRDPLRRIGMLLAGLVVVAFVGWAGSLLGFGRGTSCGLEPPAGVVCYDP